MKYGNKQEYFEATKAVAEKHGEFGAVRDFEAWTDNYLKCSPEDNFYNEFPEHRSAADDLAKYEGGAA